MESINKMLTKQTNVTIAFIRDKELRRAINEAAPIWMPVMVTII